MTRVRNSVGELNRMGDRPETAQIGPIVLLAMVFMVLTVVSVDRFFAATPHRDSIVYLHWRAGLLEVTSRPGPCMPAEAPADLAPVCFEKIPVNRAEPRLLQTISGIGPVMAAAIVATRDRFGPFRKPEDLLRVSGIGPKRMFYWKDQLDFEH